jgi:hypothetical protein
MAKKSNRSKARPTSKPQPKPAIVESEQEQPEPAPAVEPRAPRVSKVTRSQMAAERLEDEYGYITGDLRRVFILAAALFALLIVLNLILGLVGG